MIHLLYGEDNFLLKRELESFQKKILSKESLSMNRDLLEGKGLTAETIIRCAETLPMMGGKRLVIVYDAELLHKDEVEKLVGWMGEIPEMTELVLVAKKVDRRIKAWQTLLDQSASQEFAPLKARSAPVWVSEECASHKKKISREAAFFLISSVGTEAGILSSALEKLFLYVGHQDNITLKDVERCVADVSFRSIFELTDAIGKKNRQKCFEILSKLDTGKGNFLGVLGMISRHFRILLKAKSLVAERVTDRDMARRLGVPPYFVRDYRTQSENFSEGALQKAFDRLYQTDWALKSSSLKNELILEKLVWDLTAST